MELASGASEGTGITGAPGGGGGGTGGAGAAQWMQTIGNIFSAIGGGGNTPPPNNNVIQPGGGSTTQKPFPWGWVIAGVVGVVGGLFLMVFLGKKAKK